MVAREKIKTADGVLGTGKVELFDGLTGRMYRVEKFENFLSLQTLRYQRQQIRSDYARNLQAPQATQDPAVWYPLSHLGVWNDSSAESPSTEDTPNGGMVGYANKTAFGGADPWRGGINLAESLNAPGSMKWVFDWPTSSANGTFQSVGWCSLVEGNHGGTVPVFYQSWALTSTKLVGPFYIGPAQMGLTVDTVSDKLYKGTTSGLQEINPTTGADVGAVVFVNAGENFVAYDSTGTPGFWFAKTAVGVSPCLVKRTLANAIVAQVNTTWTAIFGSAVGPTSLTWDGTYLYACKGDTTIYRIKPSDATVLSFSVSSVMSALSGVGADPWGVLAYTYSHTTNSPYGNNILLVTRWSPTGKHLAKWMVNDGGWDNARPAGASITYRPSNRAHYMVQLLSGSGYLLSADMLGSLGTRTLLASPVTKDSSKSMKITYTFTFV